MSLIKSNGQTDVTSELTLVRTFTERIIIVPNSTVAVTKAAFDTRRAKISMSLNKD